MKAAFKSEYGYELAPPSTYEQLLDIASFFTRDTNGDGKIDLWGLISHGDQWTWGQLVVDQLLRNGIYLFDENFHVQLKDAAKRDRAIEIFQFWQDLVYKDKVMPPDQAGIMMAQMAELWKQGAAAMGLGWWSDWMNEMKAPAVVDRIGETGTFNIFPVDDKTGGWLAWSNWLIVSTTENPEAAWEFLKWACSEEIQMEVSQRFGYAGPVPAWNNKGAEKGWIPTALPGALAAAKPPIPIPIPETPSIMNGVYSIGHALLANALTPEQAVDQIVEYVEKKLKKGGYIK